MRTSDIFLFLCGNAGAIERIAADVRLALLTGAILILTAGLARNYDHLSLLNEPEWFLGPFAMSIVSAVFIFLFVGPGLRLGEAGRRSSTRHGDEPGGERMQLLPQFLTFLAFFWMTAPCAWLYGLPVERFTDLASAAVWNVGFLIVVSVWRIWLIVRAVVVLTDASAVRTIAFVLLPASVEMFYGTIVSGMMLTGIMSGVQLPPHHKVLLEATAGILIASVGLGLAALVTAFISSWLCDPADSPLNRPQDKRTGRRPLMVAGIALGFWVAAALPLQRALYRRWMLTGMINREEFPAAVTYASQFRREDFPRHHYLPPDPYARILDGQAPFRILEHLDGTEPGWLREVWLGQAVEYFTLNAGQLTSKSLPEAVFAGFPELKALRDAEAGERRR